MGAVPLLDLAPNATARASAILTGAYVYGSIVDVTAYRKMTLWISVDGASAANEVTLIPVRSNAEVQPAAGDDVWFPFSVNDATVTAADLGLAVPSGADYTIQPNWGRVTLYPLELRLKAITNTTDKIRLSVTIDVEPAKWFQIACADADASGTLSTAVITYTLTI